MSNEHSTEPPRNGDRQQPGGETPVLPCTLLPGDPRPYYQQLVDQVRELVLAGRLAPGTLLPSVRALARQLRTSVITTRRAYEELERAGLIVTRQGTGSFVAPLESNQRREEQERSARSLLTSAIAQALQLGVSQQRVKEMVLEILDSLTSSKEEVD